MNLSHTDNSYEIESQSEFYMMRTSELSLIKEKGLNPYPHKFQETRTLARLVDSEYSTSYDNCEGFDMTTPISYEEFTCKKYIVPNSFVKIKESIIARVSLIRLAKQEIALFNSSKRWKNNAITFKFNVL